MHRSMLLEADWQLCLSYPAFSVTDRLRALLTEQLPTGDFSLKSLARQLAISPRTLQRKLAAEGENFNQVLETMRMELADHYLRRTETSIMNIALMLGYSQASSFSHSFRQAAGFRRWITASCCAPDKPDHGFSSSSGCPFSPHRLPVPRLGPDRRSSPHGQHLPG
jgi:AraC-like DNA-binding protein